MRLTLDPVKSTHRPFFGYALSMFGVDFATYVLFKWRGEWQDLKSGTMTYWYRPGDMHRNNVNKPPIAFVHGIGIGVLPYWKFVRKLVESFGDRDIFLVTLPHISMRIGVSTPSDTQLTASIGDMLKFHHHRNAHFVGHSFGTAVLAGLIHINPSLVFFHNVFRTQIILNFHEL